MHNQLANLEDKKVWELTRCMKPCNYKRYNFIDDKKTTVFISADSIFSLWSVTNNTMVETEVLIYPLTSLVAEFGGVLSLFLGFSFMTLWDGMVQVKAWSRFRLTGKSADISEIQETPN